MGIVVQKFGGTSVGSVDRIRRVAGIVAETVRKGHRVVVVVSAMGKTTDDLVAMAEQISTNPSLREMDMLLSTGEQVSIALMAMALKELGLSARSFTGWQAGIWTEPVHGKARVERVDTRPLLEALKREEVPVVAGFQGISETAGRTQRPLCWLPHCKRISAKFTPMSLGCSAPIPAWFPRRRK
jgi:aspartate kinase